MRRFGRRHPRAAALAVLGLFAFLFAAPRLVQGPVDLASPDGLIKLEYLVFALQPQLFFVIGILVMVLALGWLRFTRLTTPVDRHGLRIALGFGAVIGILFGGLAMGVLIQGESGTPLRLLLIIVALNLLVGIFEEVLFRGILFHGLRARHSLWVAAITSSIIFGLFHAINIFVGQSLAITSFQIVNAAAIGLFFCAIMLQSNSLWPAIALHALWNCYAMTGQLYVETIEVEEALSPQPGPLSYLLPVAITAVAVVLIRRWQARISRPVPPPIPQN